MSNGQQQAQQCLKPREGKFRGKVISTEDPEMKGRLLCFVPALPNMLLNWAEPSVPYAGIEQGMFALPEEGADVWVEFEGGNPNKAIWTGGYWEEGLEPIMPELAPEAPELVNAFRSKLCTLIMNDTPEVGGVTLSTLPPATNLPVNFLMTSVGLTIEVGELILTMNPESGITLTAGEAVMNLSPAGLTVEAPAVNVTAEAEVNVTVPETSVEGNVTISGGLEVEGAGEFAGEVSVGGALTVGGATELAGEANVTGALTAEGEVNVAGALTAEGEVNVAGELSAEGDVNILGAQNTEGNNATIGLIEGIVVPPALL